MSVINNKLAVLSNTFSKQKFYFYCQKPFYEQFYAVLTLYGFVGYHHMELAISRQPNCYI